MSRCPHGFLGPICVVEDCSHWDGLRYDVDSRYRPGTAEELRGRKRARDRERARERYYATRGASLLGQPSNSEHGCVVTTTEKAIGVPRGER